MSLIHARIARQSPLDQTVFHMRFEEGRTVAEVCQKLRLPRGYIRGIETRLLQSL